MFMAIRRWIKSQTSPTWCRTVRPVVECLEERRVPTINTPFRVNTFTDGNMIQSANSSNASGESVVVWGHQFSSRNTSIRAQIFNPSQQKVGSEIVVSNDNAAARSNPQVALDARGNFVVVWQEVNGIFARRFLANGTPRSNVFAVALPQKNLQQFGPDVSSDARGNFIVTYNTSSNNGDFGFGKVYAISYNGAGKHLQTITVTSGGGDQNIPVASSIAESADGRFVVGVVATTLTAGLSGTMTTYRFTAAGVHNGDTQLEQNPGIDNPSILSCAVSVDNAFNQAAGWQLGTGVKLAFMEPDGDVENTEEASETGVVTGVAKDLSSDHAVITWNDFYAFSGKNTVFIGEYNSDGVFFGQFALNGTNRQGSVSSGKNHVFLWTYVNGVPRSTGVGTQIVGRYREFVVS